MVGLRAIFWRVHRFLSYFSESKGRCDFTKRSMETQERAQRLISSLMRLFLSIVEQGNAKEFIVKIRKKIFL